MNLVFDKARWPNFSLNELKCSQTGLCEMQPSFLDKLQALREEYAKPIHLSSAYRHTTHPVERNKKHKGTHALGLAVDIKAYGDDAHRIISLAHRHGFTGIGVSQSGEKGARFIHLDAAPNETYRPRPWIWSY